MSYTEKELHQRISSKKTKILPKKEQWKKINSYNYQNLVEHNASCPVCGGYLLLTRKTGSEERFQCYGCKSEVERAYNSKDYVATYIPKELGVYDGLKCGYKRSGKLKLY